MLLVVIFSVKWEVLSHNDAVAHLTHCDTHGLTNFMWLFCSLSLEKIEVYLFVYCSTGLQKPCELLGSHSGEYEYDSLLGYSFMLSRWNWPVCRGCILPPSSGQWWRQYTPHKHRCTSMRLHGTMFQKKTSLSPCLIWILYACNLRCLRITSFIMWFVNLLTYLSEH
jgi:hypothetical protein